MADSYATFKGIDNFNDVQLLTEIEHNLKYWLDWSFLSVGAWSNASGYTGVYLGNPSKLNWVKDNSYPTGSVWQSARKDWVWEQPVNYKGLNPVVPVVKVNSVVTGASNYTINYPLGRIIFNSAQPTGSNIMVDYSYRSIQVYTADDAPWWRELQYRSFDSVDSHFTQDPRTGDWSIGSYSRIQLPSIIVEVVPRGTSKPYEIGNGSLEVEQDVLFHILTDDRVTRNNLTSMLFLQNDKYIYLFNSNAINSGQLFPLNCSGSKVNNIIYPNLVSETGFRYKRCRFTKTNISEVQSVHPNLHEAVVRTTLNVVFGEI